MATGAVSGSDQHVLNIDVRQHATSNEHPLGAANVGSFPLSPTRQSLPWILPKLRQRRRRRDVDPLHPPGIDTDGRRRNTLSFMCKNRPEEGEVYQTCHFVCELPVDIHIALRIDTEIYLKWLYVTLRFYFR